MLLLQKTKLLSDKMDVPVACEVCAGAGGLSEGLEQAGFNVKFANEINAQAALTYTHNHPSTLMTIADMRNLDVGEIKGTVGDELSLLAGGLPCQGFSMAGKRNLDDPRNKLYRGFLDLVYKLEPKFFLIENVMGMLSFNGGKVIMEIEKLSEDLGYSFSKRVLNAAWFGVPQNRNRLFIVGSRGRNCDINSMRIDKVDPVTVSDAISDLSFLRAGEQSSNYILPPSTPYQSYVRKRSSVLHNHEAPVHSEKTSNRFSALGQGKSARDLPKTMRTKKRVLFRLAASALARTIVTIPDDMVHYSQDRVLTVREMARLQSFRDSYVFLGPRSTGGLERRKECPQYTQVANSVPPLLSKGVGKWILSSI